MFEDSFLKYKNQQPAAQGLDISMVEGIPSMDGVVSEDISQNRGDGGVQENAQTEAVAPNSPEGIEAKTELALTATGPDSQMVTCGNMEPDGKNQDTASDPGISVNLASTALELPAQCNEIEIANYALAVLKDLKVYLTKEEKYRAMLWEGQKWSDLSPLMLDRRLMPIISALPGLIQDPKLRMAMAKYVKTGNRVTKIRNALMPLAPLIERSNFDNNPEVIGVINGKIDLQTGEFSKSDPGDLISKTLGTSFDASARCPRFEKFIAEIMLNDAQLIALMQQILGYCLLGHNKARLMFFFQGDGKNGKSTLIKVLTKLFGEYLSPLPQKVVTGKNPDDLGDGLKAIQGFRILSFAETDNNTKLAVGKLKSITGGDANLVRDPHLRNWTIVTIGGKILFITNHLPFAEDASDALWDRLRIVPFDYRIPKDLVNHLLDDEMVEEFPGVLNWLLAGLKTVLANNLIIDETPRMLSIKTQYRTRCGSGVNPLGVFLERFFIADANGFILSKDLMASYNKWVSKDFGKPSAIFSSYQQLKRAMEALDFAKYSETSAQKGYHMTAKL